MSWEVTHGVGWTVVGGGGADPWVRRRETIGQRINNTPVCPVLSPSDSKGQCWGEAEGEGSVGGDIFFHTEKWGPPAALSALLFFLGVLKIGDKAH